MREVAVMCQHQCHGHQSTSPACRCGADCAAVTEPPAKFNVFDVPRQQWIGGLLMIGVLALLIAFRSM